MSTPEERYRQPAAEVARLIIDAFDHREFGSLAGMVSAEVVDFTTVDFVHDWGRFRITVEEQA